MKHTVEHPTGLTVNQVDRPYHQTVNGLAYGPIAQVLPADIEVVEADYQDDKQAYIHRAPVSWIFAICLDFFEIHGKKFVCENTE